jgi:UDP-N-acetylmuramate dehydrogenase
MEHIQSFFSLTRLNSFGIDIKAKYFCKANAIDNILSVLDWQQKQQTPLLVLGGGSNVLFTRDFDGLVLQNALKGIALEKEDDTYYYVKAMAGENWHEFVCYCVEQQYQGIENLSLIPGNVGASPMQNIGAYGVEIKDVFESLEAIHVQDKHIQVFQHADCQFGYRDSIFKNALRNQYIILSVTFKLRKQPIYNTSYGNIEQALEQMKVTTPDMASIAKAVIQIRQQKLPDPKVLGNAGSFFKNPIIPDQLFEAIKLKYPQIPGFPINQTNTTKVPAAWLIEQAGFKGFRLGDVGCYPLQPLVLVNYGNASGEAIYAFSSNIIERVAKEFNIELEREVNIY